MRREKYYGTLLNHEKPKRNIMYDPTIDWILTDKGWILRSNIVLGLIRPS